MQNKHTPIEDLATEIWALIHSGLVKDGVKFPKNFDGIGAAYGGYARLIEALQSQADQYETEKGEMVREMLEIIPEHQGGRLKLWADIKTIAEKYGVDLSE